MKKVDVLIVGSGLAGTLLAFELLERGVGVGIISSPQLNKASMVAAGLVNPLVFKRLTKSWLVDDLLPVMKKTYRKLENILNEPFYFDKNILKPLSEQEKELWLKKLRNPEFSSYIFSVENAAGIRFLKTSPGYGTVTGSGYLNISRFLMLAENYFRTQNILFDAKFDYEKVFPENESHIFEDVQANRIVFCEGHFIRRNPFFQQVKLTPAKGEVLQIYAPELNEEFILNKRVFVLPVGNHRFKVGSTYEWNDLTEDSTEDGKISILERFGELVSVDFTVEKHWAGIRPTVIDRRPVLGIHPEYKSLSVFNGLGTKGVMLAPWFAREMANLLLHSDYEINSEVKLERFL